MSDPNSERRTISRSSATLSAVVKGRESIDDFWKEDTEIVTVSRLGASFNLQRKCAVGRILSMLARMPAEYRCYDTETNLYRIWGLVQHCSPVNQNTAFQIGIAFIGKYAPESYFVDPLKTYRIVGMDESGLWNVGETQAPFLSRSHHRFPAAIKVRAAVLGEDGKETEVDEEAVTENLSAGGASVFSTLNVESGGALSFKCDAPSFTSLAVVRNRQRREGDRVTIHLQFTENEFPVIELDVPFEEDEDLLAPDEIMETAAESSSEETGPEATPASDATAIPVEEATGADGSEDDLSVARDEDDAVTVGDSEDDQELAADDEEDDEDKEGSIEEDDDDDDEKGLIEDDDEDDEALTEDDDEDDEALTEDDDDDEDDDDEEALTEDDEDDDDEDMDDKSN